MRKAAWATALGTVHTASPCAQIWPPREPVLNTSAEPTGCGSGFPVNSNRVTSHQHRPIFNLPHLMFEYNAGESRFASALN